MFVEKDLLAGGDGYHFQLIRMGIYVFQEILLSVEFPDLQFFLHALVVLMG